MTHETDSSTCSRCGTMLDEARDISPEARQPCPKCGSLGRTFNLHATETITLREKIGLKQKRQGYKKPIYESVGGDDFHRDTAQWNQLSREIDRVNDEYREKIMNPNTGEVIRDVDEPLSQHVNRGSAKKKPS